MFWPGLILLAKLDTNKPIQNKILKNKLASYFRQFNTNLSIVIAWIALRRIGRIELTEYMWHHLMTSHKHVCLTLGTGYPKPMIAINDFKNYVAHTNPSGIHVLKLVKKIIILFSQSFIKLNVPLVVAYLHWNWVFL